MALVQPRVQPFLEHRQQRQHFQFLTSPRISRRSDGCVSKNDCWLCLPVWCANWAMQPSMAHNMVWIIFQSRTTPCTTQPHPRRNVPIFLVCLLSGDSFGSRPKGMRCNSRTGKIAIYLQACGYQSQQGPWLRHQDLSNLTEP